MFILLFGGALVALAVYLGLEALSVRQRQLALSMKRAKEYGGGTRSGEATRGLQERLLAPAFASMARLALRLPITASPDELRRKLIAAGYGQTVTPQSFLALKTGMAGFIPAWCLLFVVTGKAGIGGMFFFALGGAALGFVGPDLFLAMQTRKRKDAIRVQMPDILDLLCVSVEAGLGFDAALGKVTERMHGPLVEEIAIMLQEMRIGEGRAQALKNLADRLDLAETSSFARSIIQADQLGISLGRILRVQASDMRYRRQMAAEERAMK